MSTIYFYEKPGCVNNTRQKTLLREAGHLLIVYNLLQHPWTEQPEKLRSFFSSLSVSEWFNRSAPAIKNGEVIPEKLSADEAISLMLDHPILIRRPLLEIDGKRFCGFDPQQLSQWLSFPQAIQDMESCPRLHSQDCSP